VAPPALFLRGCRTAPTLAAGHLNVGDDVRQVEWS
jgi:hypothetical protein